ncbi:MAG: hypothetical protein QOF78_3010 [Phycisphaerales bacterium]|jgi:TolB-like protein|nr:hypothetical protein [Phycisphaerales bacterium]
MRHWIISAAVLLISTSFALADAPTRVMIATFTEANEQQQPDWISRAIQQSVTDELSALSSVEVVPLPANVGLLSPAQAKTAGVQFIVRATLQRLNGELRVTGRVQKVDDGKSVGGFKATGAQQQLFAIEDSIGRQLKVILAPMEAEPGLENPQPFAQRPPLPQQPTRGGFEGSELQRALEDRDYLQRAARRGQTGVTQPPVYYPPQQPTYPVGYGGGGTFYQPGCGYGGYNGGYGYGGGDTNVVIINPGNGNNGGGGGGGSASPPPTPQVPIQTVQTQRIRDAAVYGGTNSNTIGPVPYRAPGTPTKHPTVGR